MEFTSSNAGDIQRYFLNTFVKLPNFGDKLFYIYEVNSEHVLLKDKDGREHILHLHDNAPYDLDVTLPHKCVFQQGPYAKSMARIPAKQYNRGISRNNCVIRFLTRDGWITENITFDSLDGYVNKPVFPSLDYAVSCVESGSLVSCALAPRFSLLIPSGIIYCDTTKIGAIDYKKKEINAHALFVPDIQRLLLNQHNGNFKLK